VIRHLKLPLPNPAQERTEAQLLLAEAQQAGLDTIDEETAAATDDRVLARLRTNATFLAEALQSGSVGPQTGLGVPRDQTPTEPIADAYNRLRISTITAERDAVLTARKEGRYQEPAVRAVLRILDSEETAIRKTAPREEDAPLRIRLWRRRAQEMDVTAEESAAVGEMPQV
jgi:CPA1 family monovalent cation:H+ antiporter